MKIAFDLDGVLFPWTKYAYEYCIENDYANGFTIEEFFGPEQGKHSETFWYNIVRIPMIYYKAPMEKPYKFLLDKFDSSGWEIFYLTNRPEEVKCTTYNWLEDAHVPQLYNLYFVDKKSSIIRFNNINYHVDDRAKCIEDVKNFTKSFLINTFWNKEYKEPENCVRIDSVLQVESLL